MRLKQKKHFPVSLTGSCSLYTFKTAYKKYSSFYLSTFCFEFGLSRFERSLRKLCFLSAFAPRMPCPSLPCSLRNAGIPLSTCHSRPHRSLRPWSCPRPISSSQLHTLLHFHLCPIYLVVFKGSYCLRRDISS